MKAQTQMTSTPRSLPTPGPWHAFKPYDSNGYVYVQNDSGKEACVCYDIADANANANLIAAAPDLLKNAYDLDEACRIVIRMVNGGDLHAIVQATNRLRFVAEGSRTAIRKAEGAPSVLTPNESI